MDSVLIKKPSWVQILIGPRQCGKSTLLAYISQKNTIEINFDDLQLRQRANADPALFLDQFEPPLILDEVQYVPNLFPEIKKRVDAIKRQIVLKDTKITSKALYRLTGSNLILMDKNVRESLVGRASYFYLNTLTVHEVLNALPETKISEILFKGGLPELYINNELSNVSYLNEYIRTYVEKDIVTSAGIHRLSEFHRVLGLISARTGQLIDYSSIARDSGVSSVTIKEWIGILERIDIVYLLKPFFNNLNKRLIKSPKIYFLDTGLAVRLQGWQEIIPLLNSPQIGCLFETLVFAELIKFIRNYRKQWELYFWRTKEGEEIDFVLKTSANVIYAFEVKFAIQNIPNQIDYPMTFKKHFQPKNPLVVVTFGGQMLKVSNNYIVVPIAELHDYLQTLA